MGKISESGFRRLSEGGPSSFADSGSRRLGLISRILTGVMLAAIFVGATPRRVALDARDHKPFGALVARLSEPGGHFDSDNLISNETSYQHVIGKLRELGVRGGVYVGVGPDQNFTYMAKIRPRAAIMI